VEETSESEAPATHVVGFDELAEAYLQDYELQGYRTLDSAKGRVANLRTVFGGTPAAEITPAAIRQYQIKRRQEGMSAASVNRETSGLSRMFRLGIELGRIQEMPKFPQRLQENPPRQGFFEHEDYLKVRSYLPSSYQDILDFAYYSGWRRREVTELTWDEVDLPGRVVRLSPSRSKTKAGRLLPISQPLRQVLDRRAKRRKRTDVLVFKRDGITVRQWKSAWAAACRRAGVPGRLFHDCRRTAARNLIRAGVPERVAMMLTGHKTRCVFDRYNIVNERELATASDRLAEYVRSAAGSSRVAG
jgi:integrase